MERYAQALEVASLATFAALALATFSRWRRGGGAPAVWASLTFATLASIGAVGLATAPGDRLPAAVTKVILVGIVLFPYLLFRFMASFEAVPRWLEAAAGVATGGVALWSILLPELTPPGTPRSPATVAFVAAIVVQWVGLFSAVGIRLWRAGAAQPAIARRRMRLLAAATAGMNVAIVASATRTSPDVDPAQLVVQTISLGSGVLFFLGLAPPRLLRRVWRRHEEDALRRAVADLMRATRPEDVAARLAPRAASLVGAPGATILDARGGVLGSSGEAIDGTDEPGLHRVALRDATLVVRAGPFTPFFGQDELEELHALGDLAQLAFDRCALIERERAFISNAAHELRTPMTTVYGMALTLDEHVGSLDEPTRVATLGALVRQSTRAKSLIDDLLDLARIESAGDPRTLRRVRVADAVLAATRAAPAPAGTRVDHDEGTDAAVLADPGSLERILVNLLTNAYRHGGSSIAIDVEVHGTETSVIVADDGPGVPERLLPSLFEPFSRASSGGEGSGLGLAISRRLAIAMGGTLRLEPGAGARFALVLGSAPTRG